MKILIWDYESVWPDIWPQYKWRSFWPIFHGPVILEYILNTIFCMNIILGDYGSVWPQNICMLMWPIFHGPLILHYFSKTIWWMSVIFLDNKTVWPKLWLQNKYRSTWHIFHGLVILLNISKIIWWVNIRAGIMDQCDTKTDLIKYMSVSDLYFMVQWFCLYLEDYLMEKCCTWDNVSVWHKDWPRKVHIYMWGSDHWFCLLSLS